MTTRSRLALPLLLLASGCVTTGHVAEQSPPASLAGYDSVVLSVEAADPSAKNMALHVKNAQVALSTALQKSRAFETVYNPSSADQATLRLEAKILEVVDGSTNLLAGGISKVRLEVSIVDTKADRALGVVTVEGNSKKNTRTTVGGIDTDVVADTIKRAFEAAGEHLAEYLVRKRA